ncbi:MAG TPA: hypothetical protein VF789_10160 [Thermoanaerobaculia bacterium]
MKARSVNFFLLISAGCLLITQNSCKPIQSVQEKRRVINHLAQTYEQPEYGMWMDGKVYFLLEKPGLKMIPDGGTLKGLERLRVYRASVWFIHWAPEETSVLVWVVDRRRGPRIGVLKGPKEIVDKFPGDLRGFVFDGPEKRRNVARLVGEMVSVFAGKRSTQPSGVLSEGDCEWAVRRKAVQEAGSRVAAACFAKDGSLEKVVLPPKPKVDLGQVLNLCKPSGSFGCPQ